MCLTAQRINIEKLHHSYIDYEFGEKPRGESISSLQTLIAGTINFWWVKLPDPSPEVSTGEFPVHLWMGFPTASGEDFAKQAGASAWFRHTKNPIESLRIPSMD